MNHIRNQIFAQIKTRCFIPNPKFEKISFWRWLDVKWNEYDSKRVEEVGPNRACAEWLLKCGAQVKFTNWNSVVKDFNKIPTGSYEQYLIEGIRAENVCIMARGLEYFNGLKNLKSLKFINCEHVGDEALGKLSYVKNSLEELQLVFCPTITDAGLSNLYQLKKLKDLYLNYLPGVKNPKQAEKQLKEKLPQCTVEFIEDEIPVKEK